MVKVTTPAAPAPAFVIEDAVERPASLSTGRPSKPNPLTDFVAKLASIKDSEKPALPLRIEAASEEELTEKVKDIANDLNRAAEAANVTVRKRTESINATSCRMICWATDRQKRERKVVEAPAEAPAAE